MVGIPLHCRRLPVWNIGSCQSVASSKNHSPKPCRKSVQTPNFIICLAAATSGPSSVDQLLRRCVAGRPAVALRTAREPLHSVARRRQGMNPHARDDRRRRDRHLRIRLARGRIRRGGGHRVRHRLRHPSSPRPCARLFLGAYLRECAQGRRGAHPAASRRAERLDSLRTVVGSDYWNCASRNPSASVSSSVRTAGSMPLREANTACTTPACVVHPGSKCSSRPSSMSL
jgi:hypothetical protein